MLKSEDPNFYRVGAEDRPPEIWQGVLEIGLKGTFARLYQGPDLQEKKWYKTIEEAATWLCIQLKEKEVNYLKELSEWKIKHQKS